MAFRAYLKIERGPAAGDVEGGQGGEGRVAPRSQTLCPLAGACQTGLAT
jgi:hypothetical protein